MEFLAQYGLFLAKVVTFVVAFAIVIIIIVAASTKGGGDENGAVHIKKLNDKYDDAVDTMNAAILDDHALQAIKKQDKKQRKEDKQNQKKLAKIQKAKEKAQTKKTEGVLANKENESNSEPADAKEASAEKSKNKKRIFVTSFNGDMKASQADELREVITSILSVATPEDEVIVKLESPGGVVHGYGLAASQLARVTEKNVPLTVCVDKVAASGGYMMACVANKIIAAPFAIIGSIGVLAQIPNFHKLLKKNNIEYETLTAGEYKRTLTLFGENTDKGRKKFKEDLEDTHQLFKDFITEHRPVVDIESVATGEIWFGSKALEQKLIDGVQTSDAYLFERRKTADLFEVKYSVKPTLTEKLGIGVEASLERVFNRAWQAIHTRFL